MVKTRITRTNPPYLVTTVKTKDLCLVLIYLLVVRTQGALEVTIFRITINRMQIQVLLVDSRRIMEVLEQARRITIMEGLERGRRTMVETSLRAAASLLEARQETGRFLEQWA